VPHFSPVSREVGISFPFPELTGIFSLRITDNYKESS
jgi:hypothetical protein